MSRQNYAMAKMRCPSVVGLEEVSKNIATMVNEVDDAFDSNRLIRIDCELRLYKTCSVLESRTTF